MEQQQLSTQAKRIDGTTGKESACQCRRHKRDWFDPWVWKIPWRRKWQPTPVFLGFPGGSISVKNLSTIQETQVQPPGLGRSPGEGSDNPLQYSCLGNPMDRGTWWATIHGLIRVRHNLVTKPIFLPEESHRQRSLQCYNPCGSKESGVTELSVWAHTYTKR